MAFDAAIAEEIWNAKYRFTRGGHAETSIEDTWSRVAAAASEAELPAVRACWRERFRNAFTDFQFLPAGRILAGAGTDRAVTLANCFVMGTIPDSLEGIFTSLRETALTLQQGAAPVSISPRFGLKAHRYTSWAPSPPDHFLSWMSGMRCQPRYARPASDAAP